MHAAVLDPPTSQVQPSEIFTECHYLSTDTQVEHLILMCLFQLEIFRDSVISPVDLKMGRSLEGEERKDEKIF